MRTLKFRIWVEDSSRFYFLDSIFNIPDPCYTGETQQFTGLFDKSGVEIYEGDIVDMPHWEPRRWVIDYSNEIGGFYFRHNIEQPYDTCHPMRYLERATVIGNVYENPELLG